MLLFTASIVNQTKKKFNVTFIKLLSFEVKVDKCEPKVVVSSFQTHIGKQRKGVGKCNYFSCAVLEHNYL